MSEAITCAETRAQLALMLYGELSFDEEERVESHLDYCSDCRGALEREKALFGALDGVSIEPAPSLLRECRADLAARLSHEPPLSAPGLGWWDKIVESLTGGSRLILRPAGALALLALGFFAAKLTPNLAFLNSQASDVAEAGMARVRDVRPGPDGRIQIVVDETRQRTVSGSLNDQEVKSLLLEAVRDPNDPGLRASTVDLLNSQPAHSPEVRDTLIFALQNDQNEGVRLEAMKGLQAFSQEPEVQTAVQQALLNDPNSGIRMQAIDMLTQGPGDTLDRQVIGTLQQLMQREENAGLRQRCQRVLASYNASPGIY